MDVRTDRTTRCQIYFAVDSRCHIFFAVDSPFAPCYANCGSIVVSRKFPLLVTISSQSPRPSLSLAISRTHFRTTTATAGTKDVPPQAGDETQRSMRRPPEHSRIPLLIADVFSAWDAGAPRLSIDVPLVYFFSADGQRAKAGEVVYTLDYRDAAGPDAAPGTRPRRRVRGIPAAATDDDPGPAAPAGSLIPPPSVHGHRARPLASACFSPPRSWVVAVPSRSFSVFRGMHSPRRCFAINDRRHRRRPRRGAMAGEGEGLSREVARPD